MEVIRKNTDIRSKCLKRIASGDLFVYEGTLYMKSEDLGKSKECFRCIYVMVGVMNLIMMHKCFQLE